MSVRFTYDTTTIYIKNPDRMTIQTINKPHVKGRTNTGALYRYNRGYTLFNLDMNFTHLNTLEKNAITSFYNLVNGIGIGFVFQNYDTTVYNNMIFVMDTLIFTDNSDMKSSDTTYTIGGEVWPTTTRKEFTWNLSLSLEQII